MSSEFDPARSVAERIARRVSGASPVSSSQPSVRTDISSDLAAVRAGLNDLQSRLIQIESRVNAGTSHESYHSIGQSGSVPRVQSPWLSTMQPSHPSQERFGVEEATVSELVDFF